jgi:hypothetical protein
MPFPKSAQSKGGKAAASDHQKAIAKVTITQVKPWSKSTGPKTPEGLEAATRNIKQEIIFKHKCRFSDEESFDAAKDSFLALCSEVSERLKTEKLGRLDYTVSSRHGMSIDAAFRVWVRLKTSDGVELAQRLLREKPWMR